MGDSKSNLPELICSVCENHLSIFPVYVYEEDHNFHFICGRCPSNDKINLQRQVAYESLAQDIIFSCKYEQCDIKLQPVDLKVHESWCKYRQYRCPSLPVGDCTWRGDCTELSEHYKKDHRDLFVNFDQNYDVDLIKNFAQNFMTVNDVDEEFIVYLNYDYEHSIISCRLRLLASETDNKCAAKFVFTIAKAYTVEIENVECEGIGSDKDQLDLKHIQLKKPVPTLAEWQISISTSSDDVAKENADVQALNHELFEGLICPICLNYMKRPIFQCVTGHSVCEPCKSSISQCPLCQSKYGSTRNFSLENFCRFLVYPCVNREYGCNIALKLAAIENHEDKCAYVPYVCPFQCSWTSNLTKFIKHVSNEHIWIPYNGRPIRAIKDKWVEHLLQYDNNIFFVNFKHSEENYYFLVYVLRPTDTSKKYAFEFTAYVNDNKIAVLGKTCKPIEQLDHFEEGDCIKLDESSFEGIKPDEFMWYVSISAIRN